MRRSRRQEEKFHFEIEFDLIKTFCSHLPLYLSLSPSLSFCPSLTKYHFINFVIGTL